MMASLVKLKSGELMSRVTLTVRIPKMLAWRVWLGGKILILGARVIGCGIKFEQDT